MTQQDRTHGSYSIHRTSQLAGAVCRLLIVDDADLLRAGLLQHLANVGHTVCGAPTGFQALLCLNARPFDLVLIELNLPDMDGYTLCRQIRQHYMVPLIVMSEHNIAETRINALAAGASLFVSKPFSLWELQQAIHEALTQYGTKGPQPPLQLA
jgi:DNA-binding response OmpR family regulator